MLSCAAEGAKLLVPVATAAAACERLRKALTNELRRPVVLAARPTDARNRKSWADVVLRFAKPGVATARVTTARFGRLVVHPDAGVSVSDRALDLSVIDILARAIARTVDGRSGRR